MGRNLKSLAASINAREKTVGRPILEHARAQGKELQEAREMCIQEQLPWLKWLRDNVEVSQRTAWRYMKVYNDWCKLAVTANLGLEEALKILSGGAYSETSGPSPFDYFDEAKAVFSWLTSRRDRWPGYLRARFTELVRDQLDRIDAETPDDAGGSGTDGPAPGHGAPDERRTALPV